MAEHLITGPDGTQYTLEQWVNSHIVGTFEMAFPGGKVRKGGACSCGWRTPPFDPGSDRAKALADEHKQLEDLADEMRRENG